MCNIIKMRREKAHSFQQLSLMWVSKCFLFIYLLKRHYFLVYVYTNNAYSVTVGQFCPVLSP